MSLTRPQIWDIAICGGGVVGWALSLALRFRLGDDVKIAVIDRPARAAAAVRAFALAPDSQKFLAELEVWPSLAASAQPVVAMEISDSRLADPIRTALVRFASDDVNGPLAHIVSEMVLVQALAQASRRKAVTFLVDEIVDIQNDVATVNLELKSKSLLAARLVVAADGVSSRLRETVGIRVVGASYEQAGIVATIRHQRDHEGRAVQHFLPEGPFARLPMTGRRSSIVWTLGASNAADLLSLSPDQFLGELERRFGLDLGEIEIESGPSSFPLRAQLARSFVAPRLALVGDSAHAIHPLAGQGLNLGLRDVQALAEALSDAMSVGLDPGDGTVLDRYQRKRRFSAFAMAATTDVLNRLFSNDISALRLLRDLGLGLVDRNVRLKEHIVAGATL